MLHDDQGRRVPWLVVGVDECTLDCDPLGAHPGMAHRPGCGQLPVAPVHELRVAWQHHDRWKAQCARASALMAEAGNRVVAVGGVDGRVYFSGEAVGYADFVSVVIRKDDGSQRSWAADLTHPADTYQPECAAERAAGGAVDVSHGDREMPGMWENADVTGGETDGRLGADVGRERLAGMAPDRVLNLRAGILVVLRRASEPVNVASLAGALHQAGYTGPRGGQYDPQDVTAVRNLLEREGVVRRFRDRSAHAAAGVSGSWWFVELLDSAGPGEARSWLR